MQSKAPRVDLTKVSSTRKKLAFPTALTPNGILPAPGTQTTGTEPGLTHVQQVCMKKRAVTKSMDLMSQNVLQPRKQAWSKHLEFSRRVLPFQISMSFEYGDLDDLELYPDGKEKQRETKQSEQITSYFGCGSRAEASSVLMSLPKKRGTGGIKAANNRSALKPAHINELTKDILTRVIGPFLRGHEYLLLATCSRTMIQKALWCKQNLNISHFSEVPSHRHMQIRDITDYVLLRRSMSMLCLMMSAGCAHVIQSLDFTGFVYIPTRSMRRRIREDFDNLLWSHTRAFACQSFEFWLGIDTSFIQQPRTNRLPFLQCLSVDECYNTLGTAGLNLKALRTYRSSRGATTSVVRYMIHSENKLRHLDILPVSFAEEDYSDFDWNAQFYDTLRSMLCLLTDLETARIPVDTRRVTLFEPAAPVLWDLTRGRPPFANTLRKLCITLSTATAEIHSFLEPTSLPALRELEIVFPRDHMLKGFLAWENKDSKRFPPLTQITDLHFIAVDWTNTDYLHSGASRKESSASVIREAFPNLRCMRITGDRDIGETCAFIASHGQMCFSDEYDRWPAELHYYPSTDVPAGASNYDTSKPEWVQHWLSEVKTAKPRCYPHGVIFGNFDVDCVKEVFERHVLSGGSICAAKQTGQMLNLHRRPYYVTQPTEQVARQHAFVFKPQVDVLYCTQPDAKHRDTVFKQHYDQLQYTVYALDNCGCQYHEALRFLWMTTMLRKSEYLQSLMQLVFEKSVLIELDKCDNSSLAAVKGSWISAAGHLPSTVNQEFNKQWTALCGGLQQTAEAITVLLLNYAALDLGHVEEEACAPLTTLPDRKNTTRSYDAVLRMVLLTSSLTRALIEATQLTSMTSLCRQIGSLLTDFRNSCDRLRVMSCETADVLFDMESVEDATFNDKMDTEPAPRLEEKPFERKMHEQASLFIRQETYNADFCSHKQTHFMQAFMIIADIVQHEDYIRSHVTEDAFERWFKHEVWLGCDMSHRVQFRDDQTWCSVHSPNRKRPAHKEGDPLCECAECDPDRTETEADSDPESGE